MNLVTDQRALRYAEKPLMKGRGSAMGREALTAEIASLSTVDTDELRERWKAMWGKAPAHEIGPF